MINTEKSRYFATMSKKIRHHIHGQHTTPVAPKVSTELETPILEEEEVVVISDGRLLSDLVGRIS
jgi:hypothetical protein